VFEQSVQRHYVITARQTSTGTSTRPTRQTPTGARDVLTPRDVAELAGFSYHAILRAIRRGDLRACEPIGGQYRIDRAEYERWLHRPVRRKPKATPPPAEERPLRPRKSLSSDPGSFARLRAIEKR
jgi:excisionase family DNA binding protein